MANDAILRLAPLKWRGIALWASVIETPFSHTQVQRRYPYVPIPGHDNTGFALSLSATLHFLNTIEPGMYPERWTEFRDAYFDGSSGPLEHPDLGEITAVPTEGSLRIAATSTAGVLVQAAWEQSRDDVADQIDFGSGGGQPEESAEAADEAVEELDLEYPDGEPETSLEGTVGAIEGGIFSLGQEIGGAINQAKGLVAARINAIDLMGQAFAFADPATRDTNAGNPARAVAETSLFALYESLGKRADDAAKKARPTGVYLVKTSAPLASLARQLKNSEAELIGLNSSLASSPNVSAQARVVYYTSP
jgi:hypothetical protein